MPAFEIGDKVRLIGGHVVGIEDEHNKGYTFKIGDIFEVVNRVSDGCWIEKGFVEIGWNEYFFELVDIMKKETKQEQVHPPKHDVVNNPKHYQLVDGFEVKDLMKLLLNRIEESDVGFTHFQSSCYKEAMQYFLRFMLKNGQEDIQKGVYYMNEVLKEWQESPE